MASKTAYVECHEGSSDKFYRLLLDGASVTTDFGKCGSGGARLKKDFPSGAAALKFFDKTLAEKLKKGYAAAADPGLAGAGSSVAAPSAAVVPLRVSAADGAAGVGLGGEPDLVTYLECHEGTSNKFYRVSLYGTSVASVYGRCGDLGTIVKKDFSGAAAARAFFDKTVAEKTKKGYAAAADPGVDARYDAEAAPSASAKAKSGRGGAAVASAAAGGAASRSAGTKRPASSEIAEGTAGATVEPLPAAVVASAGGKRARKAPQSRASK